MGEERVIHRKLKGPAEGINIEESMKREAREETKRKEPESNPEQCQDKTDGVRTQGGARNPTD